MLRFVKHFLLACAVLFPAVLLLTEIVLYSQNSLYLNGRWVVQKRMMKMGLIRADEFLLTRTPLARNVLNLGSNLGYQEVLYRQPLILGRIDFRFQIEDGSYLDIIYDRDDAGYSGIRLSRRPESPSIAYKSTPTGRFHSITPASTQTIGAGWHKASVQSSPSGVTLRIDGQIFSPEAASRVTAGLVGFSGGMNGAKIDDVEIQPLGGSPFRDSFRNTKNWRRTFAITYGLMVILGVLLSKLMLGRYWAGTKDGLYCWLLLSFVAVICAGSWYLFDFHFYSTRIPRDSGITRPLLGTESFRLPSFERLRFAAFSGWYGLAGGEIVTHQSLSDRGYPAKRIFQGPIYCAAQPQSCVEGLPSTPGNAARKAPNCRVLFIGSSQTIGAGARSLEETFFVRVHKHVTDALAPKFHVESINLAMSGLRAAELLKEYKSRYHAFWPHVMLINLSYNDRRSPEQFAAAIEEFLGLNQAAGIKTLLLQEARSPEPADDKRVLANYEVLRKLGERYAAPVLASNDFLREVSKLRTGALWWDTVHLTSYGQDILADWLAPQVINALRTSRIAVTD
ncbi:MAG: SGNH/GDSL hydrolase family protein [Deltaproteobacteria bacterium]|nr:SGNH/GDSL hydrolase family protein [Deltaproteobacteria bacterium]